MHEEEKIGVALVSVTFCMLNIRKVTVIKTKIKFKSTCEGENANISG